MSYIGNTPQNQGFSPAIDYFNGNGVTVTFTLSRPVASVAQMIVAVDNVIQNPSSAFSVVGNSITFTSAPLSGTNNIWVEYTSLITTYQGISQDPTVIGDIRATGGYLAEGDFGNSFIDGNLIDYVTGRGRFTVGELDNITFYHGGTSARSEMMDLYYAGGAKIYGTTALTIPVGTTAERPGTPATGMTRYNTSLNLVEVYNGSAWVAVGDQSGVYSVESIVVAGGGGGGARDSGGGGGAGGLLYTGATSVTALTAYTVTVGAGGAGKDGAVGNGNGANGSNSVFGALTGIGGGGGGGNASSTPGSSGGSGGGGSGEQANAGGAGTSGQGNAGASGNGSPRIAGGGGGAGASGSGGTGGAGSNSYSTWASATSTGASGYYAGGGGGGAESTSAGAGGAGGGGAGTATASASATSGTTNTGGGGGGKGGGPNAGSGGNGGSGIVIIRYSGAQRGTGGTVVTTGGFTYHTFTSSGTYTA
jgi:hypothetical protein